MVAKTFVVVLAVLEATTAYPWVSQTAGVDSSLLRRRSSFRRDSADCPFNPNHVPAAPVTAEFPYNNATNGKQGNAKGGYLVPHPDDIAHQYIAPNPKTDIRGPCPGINTMANHGFIARDSITTYNELVDAQQNVFNVGFRLANLLATAGVALVDGNFVSDDRKVSIGCDATSRTAGGNPVSDELGLDGHNHFEADASLTRDDYFLGNGDNYSWNSALFTQMMSYCGSVCNEINLANFRKFRHDSSKQDNPNFFFSPGSLLLYGAASFLYELFPSADGVAYEATSEGYVWNGGERIPPNWTVRKDPYDDLPFGLMARVWSTLLHDQQVGDQIFGMYDLAPVAFGGNIGKNNFLGLNFTNYVTNGQLNAKSGSDVMCFIYQGITLGFPAEFGQVVDLPVEVESAVAKIIAPMAQNMGYPSKFNSGSGASGAPAN